jgi:hypothetical protein
MGWSGGSSVMETVILAMQPAIPDEATRQGIYEILIDAFEDMDWDTQNECEDIDPAFDAALMAKHPEWYEEEEED